MATAGESPDEGEHDQGAMHATGKPGPVNPQASELGVRRSTPEPYTPGRRSSCMRSESIKQRRSVASAGSGQAWTSEASLLQRPCPNPPICRCRDGEGPGRWLAEPVSPAAATATTRALSARACPCVFGT